MATLKGDDKYSMFAKSFLPVKSKSIYGEPKESKWTIVSHFFCRLSTSILIHPTGPFKCIWDLVVLIVLLYTCIEIPASIAFGQSQTAKYIDLVIDVFLFVDIILNFHTAYHDKYDNLQLVTDKKLIAKRYITGRFIIDLITCIPFEFMIPNDEGNINATVHSLEESGNAHPFSAIKVLRLFRLLRLVKILRFFNLFKYLRQYLIQEVVVFLQLIKITFTLLLFSHFLACLWFYVGREQEPSWIDEDTLYDDLRTSRDGLLKYSYAWYWAIVTLFTTGYGDIHATNTTERIVTALTILVGGCFYAYFVGSLTALLTNGDRVKGYEYEKMEEAHSFCERKKLPKYLSHAILTHIRYHCKYNFCFDEDEILSLLPEHLQRHIHSYAAKQFLMNLPIFRNEYISLPESIIGAIAVKTKSISCHQGFKLYNIGDIAKTFYVQRTGKSVEYNKGDMSNELSRGDVLGEYSAILFKTRKKTIECETWSEFYAIDVDDIKEILNKFYPKTAKAKWRRIQSYMKHSYKYHIKHTVEINHGREMRENAKEFKGYKDSDYYERQYSSPYMESAKSLRNIYENTELSIINGANEHTNTSTEFKDIRRLTLASEEFDDDEHDDEEDALSPIKQIETKLKYTLKSRRDSVVRNEAITENYKQHTPTATKKTETDDLVNGDEAGYGSAFTMATKKQDFGDSDDSECSFSSIASDNVKKKEFAKTNTNRSITAMAVDGKHRRTVTKTPTHIAVDAPMPLITPMRLSLASNPDDGAHPIQRPKSLSPFNINFGNKS